MTRLNLRYFIFFTISFFVFIFAEFCIATPAADVKTWLARSCIGEAGWNGAMGESSECAAIFHVYKKRSERLQISLMRMVRHYSSATKKWNEHRNPWLFDLHPDCRRPSKWPRNLNWNRYHDKCRHVFEFAGEFLNGQVPDPLPDADHFGSSIDHWRVGSGWKRLTTKYRNWFYDIN